MTGLALALVLSSAVAHATWNFLFKREANPEVFIWWAQVTVTALLWPVALALVWQEPIVARGWWFVLGTSLLHALYFVLLGRSYHLADLSVVYPIARGMGPAVVRVLGVVALDETVSLLAMAGIGAVVGGIYTVYWWGQVSRIFREPFRLVNEAGTRYALLTGLVIAAYSVWDKVGVEHVEPFAYMYLMSAGSALFLAPYMLKTHGGRVIRSQWRGASGRIVPVALLMFLAYGLVLSAFRLSPVSYVAPSREVGIVIGVLLGAVVLKEPFGTGRLLGSSLIVLGLVFIAFAP